MEQRCPSSSAASTTGAQGHSVCSIGKKRYRDGDNSVLEELKVYKTKASFSDFG